MDSLWSLFTALLDGYLTATGQWVLARFGLRAHWLIATLLGLVIWLAMVAVIIAVLIAVWGG